MWRFNNSLLKDYKYVDLVKNLISEIKLKYAAFPYCASEIQNIPNDILYLQVDDQTFFDMLLLRIRGSTISYSTYRKKCKLDRKKEIEESISELQDILDSSEDTNVPLQNRLDDLKNELEEERKEELKGLILRSRVKWIEEGEKPSKYFCSLEKRNYINKTVTKLVNSKGD